VDENAAGGLVDVLAGGDEPDAEFAEPLVIPEPRVAPDVLVNELVKLCV
jgi:hypothetical protein